MNVNEKTNAVARQKLRKKVLILESAIELFCEVGIEATKIEDIAVKANVGTATVYRYFTTKAELAIQSATLFWKNEADQYLNIFKDEDYDTFTGIKQIEVMLKMFGKLYENSPKFLRFLQEFDSFVKNNGILAERLEEYEKTILNLQPYFVKALQKGIEDGTVELTNTVEETYFAITHSMLSLMQKLALNGDILNSDAQVSSQLQVNIIVNLFINGLRRSGKDEGVN
jgi:AcrR family transcriptional regulator